MDKDLLRKVQEIQIEIMDEIHNMCIKNGIMYYIIGGTALGAIRHKGMIPWDVDIDIAMKREDYERFYNLSKICLDSKYDCIWYHDIKNFNPPHMIVIKKGTRLFRNDRAYSEKFRPVEIFVDILPLDYSPLNLKSQESQAKLLYIISRLKYYKMATQFIEHNFFKKVIKRLVGLVFFIPMSCLNEWQQKVMIRYNKQESPLYICSMSSHYSYKKQCMPIEIYGQPTLVDFEGRAYFAPEKLNEYLERIYKNYMELPSELDQNEQRNYFSNAIL